VNSIEIPAVRERDSSDNIIICKNKLILSG
jgi:hypothetical protein